MRETVMEKEIRMFNFDVKTSEAESGNIIEGRAIVFGSKYDNGMWDEYIDSGALDNCDLKDVRLLINHNTDMIPLARSRNNTKNSTMQLIKDDLGLTIKARLDVDNNQEAKALYSATERGDISGMSFMFTVDQDKWEDLDTEHPTRHITAIRRVFELSAVTFPAYEETSLEARDSLALESAKNVLDNARREDSMIKQLELEERNRIERQKKKIRMMSTIWER